MVFAYLLTYESEGDLCLVGTLSLGDTDGETEKIRRMAASRSEV
jgi:hypothetical protein